MATVAAPVPDQSGHQRRGQIYVALAAVAWSTAGVLQRQLSLDLPTQVGGRAIFAALALLAYVAIVERGRFVLAWRSIGWAGVALAACLAIASGAFLASLFYTSVARVLFIQASSPVLAALLARVLLGEAISRRTAVALGLAIAGVAVMLGGPGAGDPVGDGLALLMSLAFALALVITRHRRDVSMAPATCLAQVFVAVAFLPFIDPSQVGGSDVLVLCLLGGGQIGLGLVLLTIGARLIPAAQVGLITLLEVVLGPFWVWLALGERPDTPTLIGGAIVVVAIVYQTREHVDKEGQSRFRRRSGRAPARGRTARRRRSG
jgi:drug/metabolite transporter (DMT)-like permease